MGHIGGKFLALQFGPLALRHVDKQHDAAVQFILIDRIQEHLVHTALQLQRAFRLVSLKAALYLRRKDRIAVQQQHAFARGLLLPEQGQHAVIGQNNAAYFVQQQEALAHVLHNGGDGGVSAFRLSYPAGQFPPLGFYAPVQGQ